MKKQELPNPVYAFTEDELLQDEDFEYISGNKQSLKAAILQLEQISRPYKIFSLGAGVKKITTKVDTCPKCHGTGKV